MPSRTSRSTPSQRRAAARGASRALNREEPGPCQRLFRTRLRARLGRDDVAVLVIVDELLDRDEVDLLPYTAVRAGPGLVDVGERGAGRPSLVRIANGLVVDVLAVRADEL